MAQGVLFLTLSLTLLSVTSLVRFTRNMAITRNTAGRSRAGSAQSASTARRLLQRRNKPYRVETEQVQVRRNKKGSPQVRAGLDPLACETTLTLPLTRRLLPLHHPDSLTFHMALPYCQTGAKSSREKEVNQSTLSMSVSSEKIPASNPAHAQLIGCVYTDKS